MSSEPESGPPAPSIHALRQEITARVHAATGRTTPSLLAAALTPAVYLHTAQDAAPHPGTHQGGGPHGTVQWPHHDGTPMLFLLAVRLSEVAVFDHDATLPRAGWLNVFVAPVVPDTGLPHDACAVMFTPDEGAPMRRPPTPTLTVPWRPLALSGSVHSTLQAHEFADTATFFAAFEEVEALGYEVLDDSVERVHDADFLLGKQIYATAAGLEGSPHLHDIARSRGVARPELRALLTLRRGEGGWPFLNGNVLSVSFMIDAADLRDRHFGRVMVDITAT